MRRPLLALLAGLLAVAGSPLVLAATPAAPPAQARSWGDDPLDEVFAAADAVDRCGLNRNQFVAAMLAPSWPETGADTTAPSPMTMSRWDDQGGLFAFGNASTPYRRAFWHPGVGLWQFDSAGLGAPFTASQRVDMRVIATVMAREISARYCRATGDPAERLQYAWTPWVGCRNGRCLFIFAEIYANGSLRNLSRDGAVSNTGGMQPRTCRGPGAGGTFSCWRIDPRRAEGYGAGGVGWANPTNGSPAPLSAPFYVYAAGGYEYRHWLAADTGYGTSIWARRPIGQNARSSLQWFTGETLCDVGAGQGACCPTLPVPHDCVGVTVAGTYTPVAGDFNGDGVDDVVWYAPGRTQDYLWQGTVYARFVGRALTVNGTGYEPVAGDFDGNGTDDILWYRPGDGRRDDRLWRGQRNGTFVSSTLDIRRTFHPVAADFNGDGHDDVFWYGDGTHRDYVWYGTRSSFESKEFVQPVAGLVPLAANYDGDERADVFFYGPDGIADEVWYGTVGRRFTVQDDTPIAGVFRPVAGRLDRGRRADVLWYQPGPGPDALYLGSLRRSFTGRAADIDEDFQPFVGDFNGNGVEDVFWYGPGRARDALTLGG